MAGAGVGAPTPLTIALNNILIAAETQNQANTTAPGDILEYEPFCDAVGLPRDAGSTKPQYAAYLLLVLQANFPAHNLGNQIAGFNHLLLKNDKLSMGQLKNQLDTFFQGITGLVPFAQLTPQNKLRRFVIDEHQRDHYEGGGGGRDKRHFHFEWQTVHKLMLAGALQAMTQRQQTDGDFIFLVKEGGRLKTLSTRADAGKCKEGYFKLQMGTASGGFSGHGYPLDKEAAAKEVSNAIDLDWALVNQMVLSDVNNRKRGA